MNCKPGDFACFVRLVNPVPDDGCEALIGRFVTVEKTFIAKGLVMWTYAGRRLEVRASNGSEWLVTGIADYCLQPIRGRPSLVGLPSAEILRAEFLNYRFV